MRNYLSCIFLVSCATGELQPPLTKVPGLAMTATLRADATRCTGFALDVATTGPIDPADRELADVLAIAFPTDLDFSPPNKQRSMDRVAQWIAGTSARVETAGQHYADRVQRATTDADRAAGTARIVQLLRHFAGELQRAELPVDARSGEHADAMARAYCDNLAKAAVRLETRADQVAHECSRIAAGTPGWWTTICAN
jgi:hypothetical protein